MASLEVHLHTRFARRMPDPVFGKTAERHVFICAVQELPDNLPKDPNPRAQNIDRGIWRDIRDHLLNRSGTPNTFHLKNKGISILASEVKQVTENHYVLRFEKGRDGVVDGGHTYELITAHKPEILDLLKQGDTDGKGFAQFVKIEALTGIDTHLISEIAGGLNTAVQVQDMSLANLRNEFDWIKSELALEPYIDHIAFRENESKELDARDIVVLLDLFNVFAFPNNKSDHPVRAYTNKASVLDYYVQHRSEYEQLRPILRDILLLRDIVNSEARDHHNESGGKAGALSFMEKRERGTFNFVFINKTGQHRLAGGAALPMLAAFRWMVEVDAKSGKARWRGGFKHVVNVWNQAAGDLMRATQNTSNEFGRKAHSVGRSANHWANLHNIVAKHDMMNTRG